MVYGLWFMVYGLWFMVYGSWFEIWLRIGGCVNHHVLNPKVVTFAPKQNHACVLHADAGKDY